MLVLANYRVPSIHPAPFHIKLYLANLIFILFGRISFLCAGGAKNASRRKPGYPLQSFGCAKSISASIPCASLYDKFSRNKANAAAIGEVHWIPDPIQSDPIQSDLS
jgi:hypothetical protein